MFSQPYLRLYVQLYTTVLTNQQKILLILIFYKNISNMYNQPTNDEGWIRLKQSQAAQKMAMLQSGQLSLNGKTMEFVFTPKGERPPTGYMLIFGLHGGGGCPKATNDAQYKNHKHLYDNELPTGSIWFTPRSCQDVWDMWFKDYMEDFLFEYIRAFAYNDLIDLNKVFITGYSAGGDGVYHLAPRMADHLAGAAMMAGHPNGIYPMNVRNIGFSVQCGGQDNAYNRKNEAIKYGRMLNQLKQNYGGFQHQSKIHQGMPHWMAKKDTDVFSWLFNFTRNPYPDTIMYKQCPRRRKNLFYYLRFGAQKNGKDDEQIIAFKEGNTFRIFGNRPITVLVNRRMINPQQPVTIIHNNQVTMQRPMQSRQDVAQRTLMQRMDPYYIFQDQFASQPKSVVDMNNVICNQFGITMAEKQAQYQPSLPTQVSQTPATFAPTMNPRVARQHQMPNRSQNMHRQPGGYSNQYNQPGNRLQSAQNPAWNQQPTTYQQPYNQAYGTGTGTGTQAYGTGSQYNNQTYGGQGQYAGQYGQGYNQNQYGQPYGQGYNNQYGQQDPSLRRKPDSCCPIF